VEFGSFCNTPKPTQNETPPTPQNLRNDPKRKAKVKTELCSYYLKNEPCPFGKDCHYAHGYHELKYTKVMELKQHGLIDDPCTYRTRPCFSWVSTGGCPFGQRCVAIHDERVKGMDSWLAHREVPLVGVDTTVNVDRYYYKHVQTVHQSSPLGYSDWKEIYNEICGRKEEELEIVFHILKSLKMDYIYNPSHTLDGIPCMLLKKLYFISNKNGVEEVPEEEKNTTSAHLLVFGPMDEPNVERPSIYLNIPQDTLKPCTESQAKRLRRSKTTPSMMNTTQSKLGVPIYLPQYIDDAKDLVMGMYQHRLTSKDKFIARAERMQFQHSFCVLKDGMEKYHTWPAQEGEINKDTLIPSCDQKYSASGDWDRIWSGFIQGVDTKGSNFAKRRLSVFQSFSNSRSR